MLRLLHGELPLVLLLEQAHGLTRAVELCLGLLHPQLQVLHLRHLAPLLLLGSHDHAKQYPHHALGLFQVGHVGDAGVLLVLVFVVGGGTAFSAGCVVGSVATVALQLLLDELRVVAQARLGALDALLQLLQRLRLLHRDLAALRAGRGAGATH